LKGLFLSITILFIDDAGYLGHEPYEQMVLPIADKA
jgi:hypothetical protein